MPNVSWEDIGGLDDVKCELQEVNIVLVHFGFYFHFSTLFDVNIRIVASCRQFNIL